MSSSKILIISQNRLLIDLLLPNYNIVGFVEPKTRDYYTFKSYFNRILILIYNFINKKESIKKSCKKNKIDYFFMKKGCTIELENWVKSKSPDIILVYSMSQLLKENIFTIPKFGTINFHPSILPKYRGPNPDLWVYESMEKESGVTLHYIDKGEDTGDIIDIEKFNIPIGLDLREYHKLSHNSIKNLIDRNLNNVSNLNRVKQTNESTTKRAKLLKKEEIPNFIDWANWDTLKIWHILKGLNNQYGFVNKKFDFINYEISKHNETPGKFSENTIYTKDGLINYK